MILPKKHLKYDRSLLGVGSDILSLLAAEQSVSELWERLKEKRKDHVSPISYDWFLLALCFLFSIEAISYKNGLIGLGEGE